MKNDRSNANLHTNRSPDSHATVYKFPIQRGSHFICFGTTPAHHQINHRNYYARQLNTCLGCCPFLLVMNTLALFSFAGSADKSDLFLLNLLVLCVVNCTLLIKK
jgi:hypothetical protein